MSGNYYDDEFEKLKKELNNLKKEAGKDEEIDQENERIEKKRKQEEEIEEVEYQEKKAREIVDMSSVAAGGVGVIPIPFADAIPISGIQLNMIYQINEKFNVETEAKMIVSGLGTVIGASMIGRTVASNLLKFIPIVGSVASIGTAAAITKAMGEAYIITLKNLCVIWNLKMCKHVLVWLTMNQAKTQLTMISEVLNSPRIRTLLLVN